MFRRISRCDAPCCLRPKSEGSAFGFHSFRGHTGSLALQPGDSLAILVDGFVNRLQESQFPSFLLFKLRGLNFYPGGTLTHCSCQPSLDAHFPGVISHMPVSEQCDKRMLLGALCPVQVGCEMTCSCRKTRSQESRRKYVAPRCRINDLLRFPIHFRSSILSRFSEDSAFSTATPVRNSYMLPGRSARGPTLRGS